MTNCLRIGALGGPTTFAGQAAERFRDRSELTYFQTGAEEWKALAAGAIDAFVMLAESSVTGPADLMKRAAAPEFPYYIVAEAQVPYGCLLLAKPGSGEIERILGHGSVSQCKAWLDAHYPGVPLEAQETSSLEAAEKVLNGDGSLALVGTTATAEQFGLDILAREIDGGATGRYWLVGRKPDFAENPRTATASGRFGSRPELTDAITAISGAGYWLRSIACWPTGQALFEYDYLLAFSGDGELAVVREASGRLRLLGAF